MDALLPLAIGWYGKLPSRGDFVGSGLPHDWQRTWDEWLQRALAHAARHLGAAALRDRLAAMPPWQGLVRDAQAPATAWCAVVAASADRVGRVFPLLVAEAFDAAAVDRIAPADLHAHGRDLAAWLEQARAGSSPKAFDARLAQRASAPWVVAPRGPSTSPDDVAALLGRWPAAASFWWCLAPVAESAAPFAEDWPPRDALLLDWLGA